MVCFKFHCMNERLVDDKLYNIRGVIQDFPIYFGMSLEQLLDLFRNYNMYSFDSVSHYIRENLEKTAEYRFPGMGSEDSVKVRVKNDYDYLEKYLLILSKKGIQYLMLLLYLQRLNNTYEDTFLCYEEQLKEMGFFHYRSMMNGRDIKDILIAIQYVQRDFHTKLHQLNNLFTFHEITIDSFSIRYGGNKIYPEESIVLEDENKVDNTSIFSRKRSLGTRAHL